MPARQASTWFTYIGGMEGWVDLGDQWHAEMMYLDVHGWESELATFCLLVWHLNNYTTKPIDGLKAQQ